MRTKGIVIVLLAAVLLAGCTVDQLKMAARGIRVSNQVVTACEGIVTDLRAQGLIEEKTAVAVLYNLQRARAALQQASTLLEGIKALEPATAQKIISLIDPVAVSVSDMLENGLLGVKNPDTRRKIAFGLSALRMGLAALRVALEPGPSSSGVVIDRDKPNRQAEFKQRIDLAEDWLKAQK